VPTGNPLVKLADTVRAVYCNQPEVREDWLVEVYNVLCPFYAVERCNLGLLQITA